MPRILRARTLNAFRGSLVTCEIELEQSGPKFDDPPLGFLRKKNNIIVFILQCNLNIVVFNIKMNKK